MKKEHLIIIIISVFIILLNNLPFIYGAISEKDNLVFLGRTKINSQDTYTYVSFIEQAKQGRFLFENLFMSEPQQSSLFRPSYIIIGKLAAFFNISSIWAYHLSRLVLTIGFLITLYFFLSLFFEKSFGKILAFLIVLSSSGLGFIFGKWLANSTDLWVPESITFLSLSQAPHFILSIILMLWGFYFYLKGVMKEDSLKLFLLSGFLFLFLSFEHPFNIGVVGATLVLTTIWFYFSKNREEKTLIGKLVFPLIIIIPFLIAGTLYQIYETYQNPVMSLWAIQNKLISPDPINYISGYGLILVLALIAAEKFLREQKPPQVLLLSWIASGFALLYSPIFFQRRFSEGLHIPLAILAVFGILWLGSFVSKFMVGGIRKKVFYILILGIVFILSLGNFTQVYKDIKVIGQDSLSYYYYHLLKQEIEAMYWLKQQTSYRDIILANWFYGNVIPGIIGRKSFVGHKIQTPFFDRKISEINKFLLNKNSDEANSFLKKNGITYIFLGRDDSMLSYGFKPDAKPYLMKVYDKGDVLIYKVLKM